MGGGAENFVSLLSRSTRRLIFDMSGSGSAHGHVQESTLSTIWTTPSRPADAKVEAGVLVFTYHYVCA